MTTEHEYDRAGPADDAGPSKWGAPIVAIGAFFVIVAAIAVGVYLIYSGRVGQRERVARAPTSLLIVGEDGRPLAGAWLLVRSTTDRRILGQYQKLVGRTAIFRADASGTIPLPASINKHDNLDLFAWHPGHHPAAGRRFVKRAARPSDMFVERGSDEPARALTKGETIEIRMRPARGEEKQAALARVRKQLESHDASLHHDDSLSVESLRAALDAAR